MHSRKLVDKYYPGLMNELVHLSTNYLPDGPLKSLQMALSKDHKYIDECYIREKIHLLRTTIDGIEHDMNIVHAILTDKYITQEWERENVRDGMLFLEANLHIFE
jgi:hypothetical protein